MTRVMMVSPGETGYIGESELYSWAPGRIPLIMPSLCTTPAEVLGEPLEVYRNPDTNDIEVKVRPGVKATWHPGAAISPQGFLRVVMVLPNGTKVDDRIPDGYWERWDGSN